MTNRWIFFDIDGTLLYAHRVGREAFSQAFREAFGWEQSVSHINFHGATDAGVLRAIAAERGEKLTAEQEQKFFECLAPAIEKRLAENLPEVFPGVKPLLEKLAPSWNLGIVTGNIEPTAKLKLHYAGLLNFFSPHGFGTGSDHEDRAEIARAVLNRTGNPSSCVLIGDTPNDINAAKKNNMISIAVATGGFIAGELVSADAVFENFFDLPPVINFLERA